MGQGCRGLAPSTLDNLVKPVIEVCDHYGTVPWRLTQREVDKYFAGPGKRARSTQRAKIGGIDAYFAFLEQRYAGEIMRRFGAVVESPVDPFNRPRHRGDFGLRVPPSQAAMRAFFARWRQDLPQARKYAVACRDYVMAKIAYLSGARAAELCGVCTGDVHWEHGQWGRFLVNGKGAHGSGPRQREAYLFQEGRELLWWYIEEVRSAFGDDPGHPRAPLWPSERKPTAVAALNLPIAPALVPFDVPQGAARGRRFLPDGPGHRPVPAPAAPCLRYPQLRAGDEPVGGPEGPRARLGDHDLEVHGDRAGRPRAGQPRGQLPGGPAAGDGQGQPTVSGGTA